MSIQNQKIKRLTHQADTPNREYSIMVDLTGWSEIKQDLVGEDNNNILWGGIES